MMTAKHSEHLVPIVKHAAHKGRRIKESLPYGGLIITGKKRRTIIKPTVLNVTIVTIISALIGCAVYNVAVTAFVKLICLLAY